MDLPVLVLAYCTVAIVVLIFLLTALRGARRVDDARDEELIAALKRRRDVLRRKRDPLPPLRTREAEEPLPSLKDESPREPA